MNATDESAGAPSIDMLRPTPATKLICPLPPLLDSRVARLIQDKSYLLHELADRYGSPFNIVFSHSIKDNIDHMRKILSLNLRSYEIFYAAKVNKSQALVRAAVAADVGIDVSSVAEFEDALRSGADPARVCATGPAKTAVFHQRLVATGGLIAVDSLEELNDLGGSLHGSDRARVLLRYRPLSAERSRFGLPRASVIAALHRLTVSASFVFEGFHIHLGGYGFESRVAAVQELASLVETATELGLSTRMIDIGGGMPVRYVDPEIYRRAMCNQSPEIYKNGMVPASFYPYGSAMTAADWLTAFLQAPCRGGTIAEYFRSTGLQLAIEPGRSVVNQAAVSVFRVIRVKPLTDGTAVVFVEGSSFSACETWFASEFLVDPILLPVEAREPREPGSMCLRAYIADHSCLDDDVVTNRLRA